MRPACAQGTFDAATRAKLETALDQAVKESRAVGAIVGVWTADSGWTALRGSSSIDPRKPVAYDDHTRIGSVTKTFTVTLILQLMDQGRLSIDDKVSRYFPDFPLGDQMTLRMLASMTSGIASYTLNDAWVDDYLTNPQRAHTPEELVAVAARLPRSFPPGTSFEYSNTNMVMLGIVVEKVTGKTYAEALKDMITGPLGLANTSYPSGTDLPSPYLHGYTMQGSTDGKWRDATHFSPSFAAGAGQMVSRFDDLRVWARALGEGWLLKPETQKLREQPNLPQAAASQRYYTLGLGYDHGWLAHTGELPGYNTVVAYLPAKQMSVVVIVNDDIPVDDKNPTPHIFRRLAEVLTPDNLPTD